MAPKRAFLHARQLGVGTCEHSASSNNRAGCPGGDLLFWVLSDHSVSIVVLRSTAFVFHAPGGLALVLSISNNLLQTSKAAS